MADMVNKPKAKRPAGSGHMTDGEKAIGRIRRHLAQCSIPEAKAALMYHVNRLGGQVTFPALD